jgi:hypothetical protein
MQPYIVTFDLNPGASGPTVGDVIMTYPSAMQITATSYVVATDESPEDVYNKLQPELGPHHKIYICKLECPFYGYGPKDLNQWFLDNVQW